mmetsp:Transcript_39854/g.93873  ORF Transcript_39854/g.93873 Transcript_39854/m.93873 type:complete len:266 (+) Transcript_39854:521-1318(+)
MVLRQGLIPATHVLGASLVQLCIPTTNCLLVVNSVVLAPVEPLGVVLLDHLALLPGVLELHRNAAEVLTQFLQVLICLRIVGLIWWRDGRWLQNSLDLLVLRAHLLLSIDDQLVLVEALCDNLLLGHGVSPHLSVDLQASGHLDLAVEHVLIESIDVGLRISCVLQKAGHDVHLQDLPDLCHLTDLCRTQTDLALVLHKVVHLLQEHGSGAPLLAMGPFDRHAPCCQGSKERYHNDGDFRHDMWGLVVQQRMILQLGGVKEQLTT